MKFLRTCSRLIAVFFASTFVISAFIALVLFNLQSQLLDPDTYKNKLDESGIYEKLPSSMAKQIAYSTTYNPCLENPEQCEGEGDAPDNEGDGGPPTYMKNLQPETWERILATVLTPEWIQTQTESAIDQFFAFLESDDGTLSIILPLIELKANLMGETGMHVMMDLMDAQPPCTDKQLDSLLQIPPNDLLPDSFLLCRLPDDLLEEAMPQVEALLQEAIEELPDEVIIGEDLSGGEHEISTAPTMEGPDINFRTIRLLMRFSPLLSLIFLLLATLFGVRSLKDFLLWWGIPFLIAGLTALGLDLVILPAFDWSLDAFVIERLPGVFDPELTEAVFDILRLLIRSFVRSIANQAGVVAVFGVILTAGYLLMANRSAQK
jgi:hypothetical protein